MIKLVALLSRKPGTSFEDFVSYYETNHVPLIERLNTYMADYRRSYVDVATAVKGGIASGPGIWAPDFDVITEVWFADRQTFEKARAALTSPEAARLIAEDEAKFLDRDAKRLFLTEEHRGPSGLQTA